MSKVKAGIEIEDDEEELYPMDRGSSGYTGLCVVFNIVTFPVGCLPTRRGSEKDVAAIRETFVPLGFKVVEQKDKTKKEITDFMTLTAKTIDESYRCFVCFFLSHGGLDQYMCDVKGTGVSIPDLTEIFDGTNCARMRGKPKLFFAQMCRGVDIEEYLKNPSLYDSCEKDAVPVEENIPKEQDKLIAYATSPGRMARLAPKEGSDYIQTLTKVLRVRGHKDDISGILRRVRKTIAGLNPGDNYLVCPAEDSTLTKRLIFQLQNKNVN